MNKAIEHILITAQHLADQLKVMLFWRDGQADLFYPSDLPSAEQTAGLHIFQHLEKNPQPLYLNTSSEIETLTGLPNLNALSAVPLLLENQLIGCLQISSPTIFSQDHQIALQALAAQFSLVLANHQTLAIYHELANLANSDDEWETVLTQIAKHLTTLFGADACSITLWDNANRRPIRLTAWGIDADTFLNETHRPNDTPRLTQQIVREMKPIFIPNAQNLDNPPTPLIKEFDAKALVGLPLILRGQGIGAVFLLRVQRDDPFIPEKVEEIATALDQVALAIDNQRLVTETNARVQETNTLLEIASIAASTSDFKIMLKQVLELCRQVLSVEAGAILLSDRHQEYLHYMSGSGAFGFAESGRSVKIALSEAEPIITTIFKQSQPTFYNQINEIPTTWHSILQSGEIRNILLAPIAVQDRTVGIFVVANKPNGFNFNDAGLLLAMSSHIAAVVRNTELLQDTRERLSETEILQRIAAITSANLDLDEMLNNAVQEIAQLFQADGVQILTLGQNRHSLVASSQHGVYVEWEKPVWEFSSDLPEVQVFHNKTPYIGSYAPLHDTEQHYDSLIVPAKTQQGVVGILSILRKDNPFRQSNLALAIASQIATGMQNLWLFSQERQRADLMLLINRIAQELSATLDLRNLMRKVVTNLHNTLGYEIVYIFLLDDNNENLVCQASVTTNPKHHLEVGYTSSLHEGIAGLVVRNRETQLVNDMQNHPDNFQLKGHEDIQCGLIIPLKHGNNVYGALEILSTDENSFNETDQMAMESLSSQVSIAVDNARLYNQAQRRLLEQGIVHQIGQDLTAILSYNELVQAVVRHMTRALDTSSCTVALYEEERERIRVEAIYHLPGTETSETLLKVGSYYNLPKFHAMRKAIQTRRAITTYQNHPESEPKHVMQLEQDGARSELILPMLIGKRIIGLVRWAENRRDRRFSRDDERLAQVLISQAAIAIENARLFREAERRAHEQYMLSQVTISLTAVNNMDELLESFTIQTHNALEATNTLIALADSDGQWVVRNQILITRELGDTVIGQLLQNTSQGKQIRQTLMKGESLFSAPGFITHTPAQLELALMVRDQTSIAIAPIIYRGSFVGMVEVSADPPSAIDREGVGLLEALANQISIAIDNMRLSEREQQRLKRMERLQISNRLITSELVKDNLLKIAVQEAAVIFETPSVAILLPDDYNINYVIRAAHGLSEHFINKYHLSIELRTADVEAMSETQRRRPRFYNKNAMIEQLVDEQVNLIEQEQITSVLSVPLVKGKKIAGLLSFYSKQLAYRFRDEEVDLAQLFASQIAVALDNADLFLAAEERARELAEANRLKSQFLANISHELRTPMNSILGFSETILNGLYGEINEKQASRIERIWHNGKNLRALIDDLLDLSKIDAGRMELVLEPINMVELIQSVIQTLEGQVQAKNIHLHFDSPPDDFPFAYADTIRLRQIAMNLVGNAIKFTKEGSVTIELTQKSELVLAPKDDEAPEQHVIWVSVQDTGIGISLEDQLIIFDEFRQVDGSTTREYGGTGLGLAICKRLIEMMSGRIWVDSEEGKGSRFTFVVPVAAPNAVRQLMTAESI